ncbi:hypothetical protein SLS64_007307 [Diaporthe eres]
MAEAIAALSLAANILQMVEYGNTPNPLAKDLDQLQYLTQDVEKILGDLEQNDSLAIIPSTAALGDRDRDLLTLAAESRKITKEVLDSLNKIGKPAA